MNIESVSTRERRLPLEPMDREHSRPLAIFLGVFFWTVLAVLLGCSGFTLGVFVMLQER